MTAAHEIPADVMAAAREAIRNWSNPGDRTYPLEDAVARAILAERRRAADIADATTIPFAAGRPRAEAHNAACRVISRAITGAST